MTAITADDLLDAIQFAARASEDRAADFAATLAGRLFGLAKGRDEPGIVKAIATLDRLDRKPPPASIPAPPAEPAAEPHTFYSAAQLAAAEPALPIGAIRHDLFNRESNGLAASGALVWRGRRLLIHRQRYTAWLLSSASAQERAA